MLFDQKPKLRRMRHGLPIVVLLLSLPFLVGMRREYPPLEQLIRAQEAVGRAQVFVDELARKISGEYRPPACDKIRSERLCQRTEGCQWAYSRRSERGYCHAGRGEPGRSSRVSHTWLLAPLARARSATHSGIEENDTMANFILLGLARDLNELGEAIDKATAAYGTPDFWLFRDQSCDIARRLKKGTAAGKVAARVPPQGLATPQDFAAIEQEVHEVQTLLICF